VKPLLQILNEDKSIDLILCLSEVTDFYLTIALGKIFQADTSIKNIVLKCINSTH